MCVRCPGEGGDGSIIVTTSGRESGREIVVSCFDKQSEVIVGKVNISYFCSAYQSPLSPGPEPGGRTEHFIEIEYFCHNSFSRPAVLGNTSVNF